MAFILDEDKAVKDAFSAITLSGTTVPCHIKYPQDEIVASEFPCILVIPYDMVFDTNRARWDKIRLIDDGDYARLKQAPIPYNLYYQVEIRTKKFSEVVSLLASVEMTHPPRGDIEVIDTGPATPVTYDCPFDRIDYVNLDKVEETTRIFRRALSYELRTELDSATIERIHKVLEVVVDSRHIEEI